MSAEPWPCANYHEPHTCLTTVCTTPCDWCSTIADDEIPPEVVERLDEVVSKAADVMRKTSPDEARAIIAALRRTPEDENADRLADRYEAELDRLGGER